MVAPKALPILKDVLGIWSSMDVLRRNNCATVTPNCAIAEAVRAYARYVRSRAGVCQISDRTHVLATRHVSGSSKNEKQKEGRAIP